MPGNSVFAACLLKLVQAVPVLAQAPTLSYPSPNTYPTGTPITPLVPASSNVSAPGRSAFGLYFGGYIPSANGAVYSPNLIAVTPDGRLFVADRNYIYRPTGQNTRDMILSTYPSKNALATDSIGIYTFRSPAQLSKYQKRKAVMGRRLLWPSFRRMRWKQTMPATCLRWWAALS